VSLCSKKNKDQFEIIYYIVPCKTYEEFIIRNVTISTHSTKSAAATHNLWNLVQSSHKKINYFLVLADTPVYRAQLKIALLSKYHITSRHLEALTRILYFLLVRQGYFDLVVKSKGLCLCGPPRVGKRRLITKLKTVFGSEAFYSVCMAREQDYRGYLRAHRPVLCFDDNLKRPMTNLQVLLNIFSHERGQRVDRKYGLTLLLNPTHSIVITNDAFLVRSPKSLKNRFVLVKLPHTPVNWYIMEDHEFKSLCIRIINSIILDKVQPNKTYGDYYDYNTTPIPGDVEYKLIDISSFLSDGPKFSKLA